MSEPTHRPQYSLQESAVDLSNMRSAVDRLKTFRKDLDGITETGHHMKIIWEHIDALENIMNGANNQRVTFPHVTSDDLMKAGVQKGQLIFDASKMATLMNDLTLEAEEEIADLHCRIKEIYACVNMDFEPGSHMILNAILLAVRNITSTQQRDLAIIPEIKIGEGDGVQITNPVTQYKLWLSGKVNYVVIEYRVEEENKERLLGPGGASEKSFQFAKGCLFLIQVKCGESLFSCIPEAVSQAIALLKSINLREVCFCLSNGQSWMFFILKSENKILTYYYSTTRYLSRERMENSTQPLREIVQLIREWLRPTPSVTGLFKLKRSAGVASS